MNIKDLFYLLQYDSKIQKYIILMDVSTNLIWYTCFHMPGIFIKESRRGFRENNTRKL